MVRKIVLSVVTTVLLTSFFVWHGGQKEKNPSAEETVITESVHFETELSSLSVIAGNVRPLLVFISRNDCPFCWRMLNETFKTPETIRFCELFTCVQISVSSPDASQMLAMFGLTLDHIQGTPTLLIVTPNRVVIRQLTGFQTAVDLVDALREATVPRQRRTR